MVCGVSVIRNRFIQSNESIRISGFTQSCLQASLQASLGRLLLGATVEESVNLENYEDATNEQKTNGQRTDIFPPAPTDAPAKRSYAEVAKKRVSFQQHVSTRLKSERRKRLTPLTLRQ